MVDLTGQVLGERYRVDQFLGRGGMADVYRVWDVQRAVPLALKVLQPELTSDAAFMQRFEHEAQTLSLLQHPNIVRFYGLEKASGLAFILMDFIDGLTLQKEIFLSRGGMQSERILEVLQPVCAALFYAHRLGAVHCDIKPINIMIHRNGTVYLADFGIARMTGASAQASSSAGTPTYMAPEQMLGQPPDPAMDIYSLGVVLFEMLTGGQRPFSGKTAPRLNSNVQRIIWEKQNLPPPSPRKLNPKISPEFEAIVLRCLDRNPTRRYANTLDLLHALQVAAKNGGEGENDEVLTNIHLDEERSLPPLAKKGDQPEPSRREELPANRIPAALLHAMQVGRIHWSAWKLPLRLAAGLGIVLVLAVAGMSILPGLAKTGNITQTPAILSGAVTGPGPARASATALPATTSSPTPNPTATLAPSATPSPKPTPLGGSQWIAFASDRNGSVQVWVMDVNNPLNRRQLTNLRGGACQPAWSPDGKQLAFTTPCKGPSLFYIGSTLEIVNFSDGTITDLKLPKNTFDPDWSPDGSALVFTALVNSQAEIQILELQDHSVRTLTRRGSKAAQPGWSPDGQHIAFITSDDRHPDALWVMDRQGDSPEMVNESAFFADPVFGRNNAQILATMNTGNNQTYLALFDRSNLPRGGTRLFVSAYAQHYGDFSPDGQWIAFWSEMTPGGTGEILLASIDGKQIRQLTNNDVRDFQPAWNPQQ